MLCYLYVSFFIRVVKTETPQHVLPWLQSLVVYPGSHPPTHCTVCLLHGESDKQWSLHWWIQSLPKVPSSHSRNTCRCYNSTALIGLENKKKYILCCKKNVLWSVFWWMYKTTLLRSKNEPPYSVDLTDIVWVPSE